MRKENTPPVPSGYQTPGNSSFLMRTLSLVSSKPLSKRDWQGRISPRTVGEKQHRRHRGEEVRSTSPPAGVQGQAVPTEKARSGIIRPLPAAPAQPGSRSRDTESLAPAGPRCVTAALGPACPAGENRTARLPPTGNERSASSGHGSRSGYSHTGQAGRAQEFT